MIGTSHSIDEGDGSETVTIKTSSRFHKLCGVYSNSLFYVKFKSEFFYKWTIGYHTKFRRQRNDTRRRVFTSSIIPRIRHFHVVVGQEGQRKLEMYKKSVLHVQNYCFA